MNGTPGCSSALQRRYWIPALTHEPGGPGGTCAGLPRASRPAARSRSSPGRRASGLAMIWTTWRQHRAEAAVGALILAALAAAMLVVGSIARDRARALGLPGCAGTCDDALGRLHDDFHSIPPFITALVAIPLLAGMFWAAPLVSREYEAGTHRLAWTQSVSPLRWITMKIGSSSAPSPSRRSSWAPSPAGLSTRSTPAFGGRYNSTWYEIAGRRPGRLHPVRPRRRRRCQCPDPTHHPGDGSHPGCLRGRPHSDALDPLALRAAHHPQYLRPTRQPAGESHRRNTRPCRLSRADRRVATRHHLDRAERPSNRGGQRQLRGAEGLSAPTWRPTRPATAY